MCAALGITLDQIEYIAPCSALQQGMISRSMGEESTGFYFNSIKFNLQGGIDIVKLKDSWQEVIDHHSICGQRFVVTRDGFVQVALKNAELSWSDIALSSSDALLRTLEEYHRHWLTANEENVIQPLQLLSISHHEQRILVLHIFHGIYDAISLDLLLGHVISIYFDKSLEGTSPSYLNALLNGPLRGQAGSRAFWESHLRDTLVEPFPRLANATTDHDISVSRSFPFHGIASIMSSLNVTHSAILQALGCLYCKGSTAGAQLLGSLSLVGRWIWIMQNRLSDRYSILCLPCAKRAGGNVDVTFTEMSRFQYLGTSFPACSTPGYSEVVRRRESIIRHTLLVPDADINI